MDGFKLSFNETLQENIDEVNKKMKTDSAFREVLKQYDGKRVAVNIVRDATYIVIISSEGVSMTTSEKPSPEDMYIEIDKEMAEKLLNREIDPLKILSMVLFGKIKIRNIGTEEIDLVRRLVGA